MTPDTSELPKGYSLLPEGTEIIEGDLVHFPRQSSTRWILALSSIGTLTSLSRFGARKTTEIEVKQSNPQFGIW